MPITTDVQQWVVGIDDDAVDAIVGSIKQIGMVVGELISHRLDYPLKVDVSGS